MTKDMTQGSPMRLILQFSIPLLLGNIFQQMYNMTDTVIVGRYLGISALSSVGATGSINFLIIGFCLGICAGLAIPVAQQFGAKKYSEMRSYVMNGAYVAAVLGVILTITTLCLCRWILTVMKTPEEFFDGSYIYMMIIFAGIPFTILYNVVAGIIRALGDSKTPFYFLLFSAGMNIGLDLLFIIGLNMGIAGAAWATILAQAVAGAMSLIYMVRKYDVLRTTPEERKVDWKKIRTLIVMGIPMGLQYSITAIGTIMLQSAINALGPIYVSAFAAASKVKQLAMCPYDAFANASATFCGQNLGAKKLDRIRKGLGSSIFISMIYSVMIGVVLVLAGSKIALIFMDAGEVEVLKYVDQYLSIVGYFYVALAILNNVRMTIQGLGYSGLSMWAGLFELAARGFMSLCIIPKYGFLAVCFTDQSAWVSAAICVCFLYAYVMKQIRKQVGLTDKVA